MFLTTDFITQEFRCDNSSYTKKLINSIKADQVNINETVIIAQTQELCTCFIHVLFKIGNYLFPYFEIRISSFKYFYV